jgi:serine/threonine-protein kinase
VASTLNELARLAQKEGRYDEAEVDFQRMIAIYRHVYGEKHYLIGLGLSNLGSLYLEKKDYPRAEASFRAALDQYAATLPADHLYVGITKLKLGRSLLRAEHYADAEKETKAAYDIVSKQTEPSTEWLANCCQDLVAEYDALGRPQDADKYRADLEKTRSASSEGNDRK